jgi:flagellar biosynthesis/type III secretory pathway M-ring protein FliF/YscJ
LTKESVARFDETHTVRTSPPGTEIKDMTASISLPRSYFVALYRRAQGDANVDPKDELLLPTVTEHLKRAKEIAKGAITAKTDDQIRVDWFDDTILPRLGGDGGKVATAGALGSITQYAKQGILGAVALGALAMMLMMVRRAVPATSAGAEADPSVFFGGGSGKKKGEPGQIDAGEDVYGEAGTGEAVLTGIELDDDTLQSRKMVDEVSIMIKENPENAAALVKRWVSKGK